MNKVKKSLPDFFSFVLKVRFMKIVTTVPLVFLKENSKSLPL